MRYFVTYLIFLHISTFLPLTISCSPDTNATIFEPSRHRDDWPAIRQFKFRETWMRREMKLAGKLSLFKLYKKKKFCFLYATNKSGVTETWRNMKESLDSTSFLDSHANNQKKKFNFMIKYRFYWNNWRNNLVQQYFSSIALSIFITGTTAAHLIVVI